MTDPDWAQLRKNHPLPLVAQLEKKYRGGSVAYTAKELADAASTIEEPFIESEALDLLLNAGDWLKQELRPGEPDPEFPDEEPEQITVFCWQGVPRRRPGWLLLVHGMNTTGRWQEHLAFDIGLWQGQVIPTFVFKYGRIWLGVALPWRRRRLKRQLREKVLELSEEAPKHRVGAAPDVVAHSFGTWLVGHILLDEEKKEPSELKLGRVILTGSILPPDFPWGRLQDKQLVAEVLNHYGTRDPVVSLAHWTIAGSGPSGRRGFNPPYVGTPTRVINVEASFNHSQALSDQKRFGNYEATWKPFLTNPEAEASKDLTDKPREGHWTPAWWPLRGTLLPLIVGPLLLDLVFWGLLRLGQPLSSLDERLTTHLRTAATYLAITGAGLAALFLLDRLWSFLSAHIRN